MIKLTYIVCVYNSAATIVRTLESIYRQPLSEEEFEVIVVDDCSQDNSSELVSSFALGHTNLQLVRQKQNHRVGTSMNLGIRMAKGEYIQVVDGDDVVGDGIVDTLNQCLKEKVDASINTSQYEAADGSMRPMPVPTEMKFPMSAIDFCEKVLTDDPIFGGTQFYMWRREFLIQINHPFVEDLKMEDTDWIEFHLTKANTIGCSRKMTYTYLYNENSQVHQMNITTLTDFTLQCYRRLIIAEHNRFKLPMFSQKISQASICRINNMLRYRNLTKYAYSDYPIIYKRISLEVRRDLQKYDLSSYAKMVLKYKLLTLFILYSTAWISMSGRLCVHFLRKII